MIDFTDDDTRWILDSARRFVEQNAKTFDVDIETLARKLSSKVEEDTNSQ